MAVYLKSILAGLAVAVLSLALLATVAIIMSRSSGLGAVAFNGSSIPVVVVITFAAGFTWTFRRSLRKPSSRQDSAN